MGHTAKDRELSLYHQVRKSIGIEIPTEPESAILGNATGEKMSLFVEIVDL